MAIVFIVDLQPSMGTNDCPIASPEGSPCITRLDCAKACVEFFLRRQRQQPPQCLLVTTTSGNSHVNVGWGASIETFQHELKMLKVSEKACSPPHQSLNSALSTSFQLLSHQRLSKHVDNLGLGRQPWSILPSSVILLTDGVSHSAVGAKVQLPAAQRRDDFICNAPFRWDQRLYTINISNPSKVNIPNPLIIMTDATGGRCWQKHILNTELISCVTNVQEELINGGVVIRIKSGEDQQDTGALGYLGVKPMKSNSFVNPCRQAGTNSGHWPIPEEFWCDRRSAKLPPRFVHPTLLYVPIIEGVAIKPKVVSLSGQDPASSSHQEMESRLGEKFDLYCSFGLPVDWYQLGWMRESHRQVAPLVSPTLTPDQLNNPNCWKHRYAIYSNNSGRVQGRGAPIGILMKKGEIWCLALLPYNYGELSVLLQKASTGNVGGLDNSLTSYVKNLPSAYHMPLARALTIATHPPSRQQNASKSSQANQIKPLRTNKACSMLLRLLAHASGSGGDGGLNEGFKEWQKRQTSHADQDDQRNQSTMIRIKNAMPKRSALLYHEQQSNKLKNEIQGNQCKSQESHIPQPDIFTKPPSAKLIGLASFDELCNLPISELMPRWTQISRRLYGGTGCDLLSKYAGMFSANDEPCSITITSSSSSTTLSHHTYSNQCSGLDIAGIGFRRYACVPAQGMSSFLPVLSKIELLRKPEDEATMDLKLNKKEELENVWRERMSGNFSNPYASSTSSSKKPVDGVLSDDGESFLNDVLDKTSSVEDEVYPTSSATQGMFNDSLDEMSLLVADTPIHTSSFENSSLTDIFNKDSSSSINDTPSNISESRPLSASSSLSLKLPRADLHRKKKKSDSSLNLESSSSTTMTSSSVSPVSVAVSSPSDTQNLKRKETFDTSEQNKIQKVEQTGLSTPVTITAAIPAAATGAVSGSAGPVDGGRSISPTNVVEDYSNIVLPEGWIVHYSKRIQKYYFFNTMNNTSLWEPPPGSTQKPTV